jgi:prophage antirepressor-like protein
MNKISFNGREVTFANLPGHGWCFPYENAKVAVYEFRGNLERHFPDMIKLVKLDGVRSRRWLPCSEFMAAEKKLISLTVRKTEPVLQAFFDLLRAEPYRESREKASDDVQQLTLPLDEPYLKPVQTAPPVVAVVKVESVPEFPYMRTPFGPIRYTVRDGEPWFILNDACGVMDIANPRNVKNRLIPEGVHSVDTPTSGGLQKMTIINEGNLYLLAKDSRKPNAEHFIRVALTEILPAYRRGDLVPIDQPKQIEAPKAEQSASIELQVSVLRDFVKLPLLSPESQALVYADIVKIATGKDYTLMLPPLPNVEFKSMTDVGDKLGITAISVGKIIDGLGIRHDEGYCRKWLVNGAHTNGDRQQLYLNESAVGKIRDWAESNPEEYARMKAGYAKSKRALSFSGN